MQDIYVFLITLFIFLLVDIPMITMINGGMYQDQFKRINNIEMITTSRTWVSAAIAYLLLGVGVYVFGIRNRSVSQGALVGLVIYGVYNTTNLATIHNWGVKESLIDTIWGTSLCAFITFAVTRIAVNVK